MLSRLRAGLASSKPCGSRWQKCSPRRHVRALARPHCFVEPDQPMPPPPHACEPGTGDANRQVDEVVSVSLQPRRSLGERWCNPRSGAPPTPSVEPHPGRERVDARAQAPRSVLTKIQQHVGEHGAHLPRRPKRPAMPPIRPQRPASRQQIVHVSRDADSDAADPARKGTFIRSFDDEVQVIALNGEVQDPKALRVAPRGAPQSKSHRRKNVLTSERSQPRTHRNVYGLGRSLERASPMRHIPPRRALPLRPCASAAPTRRKRELQLRRTPAPHRTPALSETSFQPVHAPHRKTRPRRTVPTSAPLR